MYDSVILRQKNIRRQYWPRAPVLNFATNCPASAKISLTHQGYQNGKKPQETYGLKCQEKKAVFIHKWIVSGVRCFGELKFKFLEIYLLYMYTSSFSHLSISIVLKQHNFELPLEYTSYA